MSVLGGFLYSLYDFHHFTCCLRPLCNFRIFFSHLLILLNYRVNKKERENKCSFETKFQCLTDGIKSNKMFFSFHIIFAILDVLKVDFPDFYTKIASPNFYPLVHYPFYRQRPLCSPSSELESSSQSAICCNQIIDYFQRVFDL